MSAPWFPPAANDNAYGPIACSLKQAAVAFATWLIGSAIFGAVIFCVVARP